MNMVNSKATPKPSTSNNDTHRTRAMLPSQPPPEQPISLLPINLEPLLTTKQVAAILKIKVGTLKKWRQRSKHLDFIRFPNGSIRYRLTTIRTFLETYTFETLTDW